MFEDQDLYHMPLIKYFICRNQNIKLQIILTSWFVIYDISWLIAFITFLFEGLDLNKCDHLTRRQLERFARKEADVYYYLSYVRILHTEENG